MIVSWNWLKDYVAFDIEPAEFEQRLMMAGLNHEGTEPVGDDLAIDLEVTSNRPDCLGHIGVAREASVLFGASLTIPSASPSASNGSVTDLTKVRIDCPDLCYRYTARIIRGIKIGPSPDWMADRLQTIGIASVSNVVDITNYVLMECGQPLHAFDLAALAGPEIIVREAANGEQFVAIDHKTYELGPGTCVIADANRAVALGGVMGGADTEVSDATFDLLIESAEFNPVSIRNTARQLNLHSPSSYRFERRVDPDGIDWASRRCCELILDLAGGVLAEGVIDVGADTATREPVVLRLSQVERVLGIRVEASNVQRILAELGNDLLSSDDQKINVTPPSWRRDLTREIDLIEEVARIHGYDNIPEDTAVPMFASHKTDRERVLDSARKVLTGCGIDEAVTTTLVPQEWSDAISPWTDAAAVATDAPMKGVLAEAPKGLSQANIARRSLIPSLLEAKRLNESLGNTGVRLFETAQVYLPEAGSIPTQKMMVGIVTDGDYYELKGVVEALVGALNPAAPLAFEPTDQPIFEAEQASRITSGGETIGFLGVINAVGLKTSRLRTGATVAELSLPELESIADLNRQAAAVSAYPAITRDLNLIVDEPLRWADLEATVWKSAGEMLESVVYQDIYRDTQADGEGKKRLLFTISLRSDTDTLTNEAADEIRDTIIAACAEQHRAKLLA